jgi:hypothetical protein
MISAAKITAQLGLRRSGRYFVGKCPCCGYASGFSVTERDGRVLAYCAAGGCDQGELWAVLLRLGGAEDRRAETAPPPVAKDDKRAMALAILGRTLSANSASSPTPVMLYLRARGWCGPVPTALRYLDAARHPTGTHWPAMVAHVELVGEGRPVAVHRTFLARDGSGKAPVDPAKMTLGPCRGAAIRLAPAGPLLAVSEGIETGLSFMLATGIPTWAALSAGGIRSLILPSVVREVVIAADPDPVGLAAAYAAARGWRAYGRRVRIAVPPPGAGDFNDLARAS